MTRVLVYGLAVTGSSVIRALSKRGYEVVCADDRDTADNRASANEMDIDVVFAPSEEQIRDLVRGCDFVVPAPGLREVHPVRVSANALGKRCVSELDLAYDWESSRPEGARPILAITGTDGKTTTVSLTAHMLREGGLRVVEAGNTDIPFVEAIDDDDANAFVVECSSFRLFDVESFRADASAWLNISPDHLDWHVSMESYRRAKERLWHCVTSNDVAVFPAASQEISRTAKASGARAVSFGVGGDYSLAAGALTAHGEPFMSVADMWRALPHDIDNTLAACAVALESRCVDQDAVSRAVATFTPPHHRIEHVAELHGVRWYDDSKATTPHAARAAIRSFDSVVLIAGGRNKDLDLGQLTLEKDHIKAVVATGEGIAEISRVFDGVRPVHAANSMIEAVTIASRLATSGDTVLLSPACTSFDWYRNYGERGDDFVRCVREVLGTESKETSK